MNVISEMLLPPLADIAIEYLTGADLSILCGLAAIPVLSQRLEQIKPGMSAYDIGILIPVFLDLPDYAQVLYILHQRDFYIQVRYIEALSKPTCNRDVLIMLIHLCHDIKHNSGLVLTIIHDSVEQGFMDVLWMLRDHPGWSRLIEPAMLLRPNENYDVSVDDFIAFSRNASMEELYSCLNSMPLYEKAVKYLPYLVDRGVDLNHDHPYHGNVVFRAIHHNNCSLITALVENKADINAVIGKQTPLMLAIDSDFGTFTTLLQIRVNPNLRINGLTALDKAKACNNQDAIDALLKYA